MLTQSQKFCEQRQEDEDRKDFIYLRAWITENKNDSEEINVRILKADQLVTIS